MAINIVWKYDRTSAGTSTLLVEGGLPSDSFNSLREEYNSLRDAYFKLMKKVKNPTGRLELTGKLELTIDD